MRQGVSLGPGKGIYVNRPSSAGGVSRVGSASGIRRWAAPASHFAGKVPVGPVLLLSLVAFQLFNFNALNFALADILGEVEFLGISWATILALAFCAVDLAGLSYLASPSRNSGEPAESWYLMAAWLLGAGVNALLTWWAVSLALLTGSTGLKVTATGNLVRFLPIAVAALAWITRIVFIVAFSTVGGRSVRPSGAVWPGIRKRARRSSDTVGQVSERRGVEKGLQLAKDQFSMGSGYKQEPTWALGRPRPSLEVRSQASRVGDSQAQKRQPVS